MRQTRRLRTREVPAIVRVLTLDHDVAVWLDFCGNSVGRLSLPRPRLAVHGLIRLRINLGLDLVRERLLSEQHIVRLVEILIEGASRDTSSTLIHLHLVFECLVGSLFPLIVHLDEVVRHVQRLLTRRQAVTSTHLNGTVGCRCKADASRAHDLVLHLSLLLLLGCHVGSQQVFLVLRKPLSDDLAALITSIIFLVDHVDLESAVRDVGRGRDALFLE